MFEQLYKSIMWVELLPEVWVLFDDIGIDCREIIWVYVEIMTIFIHIRYFLKEGKNVFR